jgi:hypothetical protein
MSSQENHLNSGEVVISPEAQSSEDTALRRDAADPANIPPRAQPEEEVVQTTAANDEEPPAALSTEETSEAAAEPEEVAAVTPSGDADEPVADSEAPAVAASAEEVSDAESPADNEEEPEDEALGMAEVESLMESMEAAPTLTVGEIVRGHVLNVTGDEVVVDLGLKCEAVIPCIEFTSDDGQLNVEPGQTVGVMVEKFDELTGTAVVSRRRALQEELWEEIERAFYEEKPVRGRVVQRVKGGLEVNIGVHAFMPASQADLKPHPTLDEWIGQEIECKVIKLNRKRDNVVVSRRKLS